MLHFISAPKLISGGQTMPEDKTCLFIERRRFMRRQTLI
jgi:hypothetical protein